MRVSNSALKELQKIIETDYGLLLPEEEVAQLGISLLKLTSIGLEAVKGCEMVGNDNHFGVLNDSCRTDVFTASDNDNK